MISLYYIIKRRFSRWLTMAEEKVVRLCYKDLRQGNPEKREVVFP
jgi:hypothetical protein